MVKLTYFIFSPIHNYDEYIDVHIEILLSLEKAVSCGHTGVSAIESTGCVKNVSSLRVKGIEYEREIGGFLCFKINCVALLPNTKKKSLHL